jgi:hypothetical protein
MPRFIAAIVCATVLAVTTGAWAQTYITGVVARVDPFNRLVELSDGRTVVLEPGTSLTVTGRPISLGLLRLGMELVVVDPGSSMSQATAREQSADIAAAVAVLPSRAVDVEGTVARVDPRTGTVTLQGGRTVTIGPHTMVWQHVQAIDTIRPGARLLLHGAEPRGNESARR